MIELMLKPFQYWHFCLYTTYM